MENNKSSQKIEVPSVSMPKGGGAMESLGDSFSLQQFSGAGSFSIPVPLPSSRALTPSLTVAYSSGGGNGPFGMGFAINIDSIVRRTKNGAPRYDDSDQFLLSGASIVEKLENNNGQWQKIVHNKEIDNQQWQSRKYCSRHEGSFSSIEYCINLTTYESFWMVLSADNITHVYGKSANSRIADPANPQHIFEWLLEEIYDSKGNRVTYQYKAEDNCGLAAQCFEVGREVSANRYLEKICYGNYTISGEDSFAFQVVFDYGEYDLSDPEAAPQTWDIRPDPFSSYRSGFEIRTQRLCQNILIYHQFIDQHSGEPFLVKSLSFGYEIESGMSFLKKVIEKGFLKNNDGNYIHQQIPATELTYNKFSPKGHRYEELQVVGGKNFPGYLATSQYQTIDLNGEGIAGLLKINDGTALYWEPLGKGCYGFPQPLKHFPSEQQTEQTHFASLNANGVLDIVVNKTERGGYYSNITKEHWDSYREFSSRPYDMANEKTQQVDLNGDGRADILVWQENYLKFYPSLGKEGYGQAQLVPLNNDFPAVDSEYKQQLLSFSDMFGDGLMHRVRIRSGSVEVWPNLGHGNFGDKVTFANAPHFGDDFDSKRLFLSDIDGSGTTDLVYVNNDCMHIYFNRSGNSFSKAVRIQLPAPFDNLSQINFCDVLGNGTSCLVLTRLEPNVVHFYYDFCNNSKPYLLNNINNNQGLSTSLTYSTTVKQYLKDKRDGRTWPTKLFFPMHIVEKIENYDETTQAKYVSKYRYHDGYYDPEEREFRGFGFIESWDTEHYEEFSIGKTNISNALNTELHVPPVYTKSWYHTGNFIESPATLAQYREEYWQEDDKAVIAPGQIFSSEIFGQGGEVVRQAYVALEGQLLRQEIYGLDDSEVAKNPYSVSETTTKVRMLQPRQQNLYAVFMSYTQQVLEYHYERDPSDPRVSQQVTLEVDGYGNVKSNITVSYPRRSNAQNVYPEQTKLKAVLTETSYINHLQTTAEPYRLLGVAYQSKNYQIGGLSIPEDSIGFFEQLEHAAVTALQNPINIDDVLGHTAPDGPWSRLLSWNRSYFWNDNQDAALALGEISTQALLHHTEQATITTDMITEVFASKVTDEMLNNDCGYMLDGDLWWNRGLIQYYNNTDSFYLPSQTDGAFDGVDAASHLNPCTIINYDSYFLLATSISQVLSDDITIEQLVVNDYRVMSPWQITDANQNTSEVLFDCLGMVIATSSYGTVAGKPAGDYPLSSYNIIAASFNEVISEPQKYLQNATTYFFYDLFAWQLHQQPICAVSLTRQFHVYQLPQNGQSPIQIAVAYHDGTGNALETKALQESKWIVSGRTVYNNKGAATQQYLPYYSDNPNYENQSEIQNDTSFIPPSILHYDSLGRVVRSDSPKGFFSKVEFSPWQVSSYDYNDTVTSSFYFQNFMQKYNEFMSTFPTQPNQKQQAQKKYLDNEKSALDKATVFCDTPTTAILDNLGQTVRTLQDNLQESLLTTLFTLDIQGREIFAVDPRLFQNESEQYNFHYVYDIMGNKIYTDSVDAGKNWTLVDIFGNQIHTWNTRNFHITKSYDRLQRPTQKQVVGGDESGIENLNYFPQPIVPELIIYGEEQENAIENNLIGQVYKYYDQAGLKIAKLYELQGKTIASAQYIRDDINVEANWTSSAQNDIDSQQYFTSRVIYNALGQTIANITPDNSIQYTSYNLTGQITSVQAALQATIDTTKQIDPTQIPMQTFVSNVQYDANGQSIQIEYGNGITSYYHYEPTTQKLAHLISEKDGVPVQSLSYTYDPMGHMTLLENNTEATVFSNNSKVDACSDYTYDGLYRLIQATGRQHPALQGAFVNAQKKTDSLKNLLGQENINNGQQLENYTETYQYDDAGNLKTLSHVVQSNAKSFTRNLAIATDSNRLTQTTIGSSSNTQTVGYSYDANGNAQSFGNSCDIIWNYRDNIAQINVITRYSGNNDSQSYLYDAGGNRILKRTTRVISIDNEITETEDKIYLGTYECKKVYSEQGLILQRESLNIATKTRVCLVHSWNQDELQRETNDISTKKYRYQLSNDSKSVNLEVDENGSVISYEEYFPYGRTAFRLGNNAIDVKTKEYCYSGKEQDELTGLYYYGMRYYPCWLGRWINPDPARTVDGLNLYAFVGGNPIGYQDIGGMGKKKSQQKCSICQQKGHNKRECSNSDSGYDGDVETHAFGGNQSRVNLRLKEGEAYDKTIKKTKWVVSRGYMRSKRKMTTEEQLPRHIASVLNANYKVTEVQAAINFQEKKITIASNKEGILINQHLRTLKDIKELAEKTPKNGKIGRHAKKLAKLSEEYEKIELEIITGKEGQHGETKIADEYPELIGHIHGTMRPCYCCTLYQMHESSEFKRKVQGGKITVGAEWPSKASNMSIEDMGDLKEERAILDKILTALTENFEEDGVTFPWQTNSDSESDSENFGGYSSDVALKLDKNS
ncbi:SpvB/TcaC N-terminal domain-containing protein [Candidatus Uabimicrobium sp. HlEnr_7]|uniref:SpvB/TcaC N-terminal domain-containing protein n=1 Tax=Candidatus Uabimicrobium helgolandensis TaxID=3095367 RepID=UPI003558456C